MYVAFDFHDYLKYLITACASMLPMPNADKRSQILSHTLTSSTIPPHTKNGHSRSQQGNYRLLNIAANKNYDNQEGFEVLLRV
jgi:hypothetical protein